MIGSAMRKKKLSYITFEPNQPKGYPAGKNVFYECTQCSGVVGSLPEHFEECECGNIEIDASSRRMSVHDPNIMRIFKVS